MMMKKAIAILLLTFSIQFLSLAGPEITYKLSMPEPHTHYFQVEMVLKNFDQPLIDVKMPVWAPGSYLIREFSRNVESFQAIGPSESPLRSYKTRKNTWRIEKDGATEVTVKYKVYAFEMSVRTSFLDADHGYLNGTSVFMYIDQHLDLPCRLEIIPYNEWKKISTALPKVDNEKWVYQANNYDQLVDCPIEVGNHREIKFRAAGISHTIAMYGEGNYNEKKLVEDMTRIIENLTGIFGENPNENYLFIIHNLEKGGGGLEHINSTTLQVNRWTYSPEKNYRSFLGLVAHEYFHLWVVKRLRPATLGPFDYDKENYTDLLWVMEGFTSYYSQLVLCRLDYLSEEEFLGNLAKSFTNVELTPGNDVQPVSMASFDAWIKAYRPDENSSNTQISYYQKGSVLAALLDVIVIGNSQGKYDLGDVLRYLYEEVYVKKRKGITNEDVKKGLEDYAGINLDDFFEKYVFGTDEINYRKYMSLVGLDIKKVDLNDDKMVLGANLTSKGGKVTVKSVLRDSPAWKYGINAEDEIVGVDGYRVTSSGSIENVLENRKFGDQVTVTVARDGKLKELSVALEPRDSFYYQISLKKDSNSLDKKLLNKWLNNN